MNDPHTFKVNLNRPHSEAIIQRTVFDHLRWRGVSGMFPWHTPNGGLRHPAVAAKLKAEGVVAGIPDLMLVHAARIYGLELKTEKGVLSDAQIATQSRLETAGVCVHTAYGLDEAIYALEFWGLLKTGRAA